MWLRTHETLLRLSLSLSIVPVRLIRLLLLAKQLTEARLLCVRQRLWERYVVLDVQRALVLGHVGLGHALARQYLHEPRWRHVVPHDSDRAAVQMRELLAEAHERLAQSDRELHPEVVAVA